MLKKIVPLGIILIVVSVVAGTKFGFGSVDQTIYKAESMVYRKSRDSRVSLGWTLSDLKWRSRPLGPSLVIRRETFDDQSSVIEFSNGNILKLEHELNPKEQLHQDSAIVRRMVLSCGTSDSDEKTMEQIVLLLALTSNDRIGFRELCETFVGNTNSGRTLQMRWARKDGLAFQVFRPPANPSYQGQATTGGLLFVISPDPVTGWLNPDALSQPGPTEASAII